MHLFDLIFPPREDERLVRDFSPADFAALAHPQLVSATRPDAVVLLPFREPLVRAAIHEAKYHGTAHAFTLLASVLADFLPEQLAELNARRATIVPIPLGRARQKERGYNQAERVAKRALSMLKDPALVLESALLERVRETATQVSLAREAREENMRGAFSATAPRERADIYIVLDDVLTTGATLQAAVDALAEADIPRERILPLALAH